MTHRGLWYAVGAYTLWGVLPVYWKALKAVPAEQVLAHRMAWSLLIVLLLLAWQRHWSWLGPALRTPRTVLRFLCTGTLLSLNWYLFIWAVHNHRVVEASLGYFINPLVNVVLGRLVLGERLRLGQGVSLLIATASVLFLTLTYGELPWVALTLAGTFSLYGLLRKTAPLGSLEGLTMETLLLFPVATGFLIWIETQGRGAFLHVGPKESWLLGLAGLATAIPLLLFAAGARRLTMTTLGMLQYIAPSLQFTLGVLLYGEALSPAKLTGFVLIWVALLVYTLESVWAGRQRKGEATARPTGPE